MLKEVMKYFKPAQATTEEVANTMTTEKDQAALVTDNATAELTAQLSTVTEAMTTLQASFAELNVKYEVAQAALNASEEAKAELAKQAAEKRLVARTAAITAAVGTDKVDALLAATDSMADEQFETIVSAMAASFDAEATTPAFSEAGIAAETVVDDKPTHFNTFIKSKE